MSEVATGISLIFMNSLKAKQKMLIIRWTGISVVLDYTIIIIRQITYLSLSLEVRIDNPNTFGRWKKVHLSALTGFIITHTYFYVTFMLHCNFIFSRWQLYTSDSLIIIPPDILFSLSFCTGCKTLHYGILGSNFLLCLRPYSYFGLCFPCS